MGVGEAQPDRPGGASVDIARSNGSAKLVLIAEPQKLLVDALSLALAGYEVVGVYGDGGEVLRAVRRWSPDLVLLGLHLRGASGIDVGRRLRGYAKVLLLVDPQEPNALQDVERSGLGFVPLDATGRSFVAIVESALDGDMSVHPVPASAPWPAPAPVGAEASQENRDTDRAAGQLTSREHDVLALLGFQQTDRGDPAGHPEHGLGAREEHLREAAGPLARGGIGVRPPRRRTTTPSGMKPANAAGPWREPREKRRIDPSISLQ